MNVLHWRGNDARAEDDKNPKWRREGGRRSVMSEPFPMKKGCGTPLPNALSPPTKYFHGAFHAAIWPIQISLPFSVLC